jgi:hypothetical protein
MRSSLRWLAWLGLSLMLWAAVAESTHSHATNTEAASCSICVVAHSSAPSVSSRIAEPTFTTIGVLSEEEITAKALLALFALGIRGPPAV